MSVGMKTMRVGLGFPTLMVFILYCIDLTSFFYNFASRSPILMIFTFLKMALKFIEKKISGGSGIRTHAYYECWQLSDNSNKTPFKLQSEITEDLR